MALQRPPAMRNEQFVGPELTVEQGQQRILRELGTISEKVGKIEMSGEMLRMNLLGDAEGETKHGRLPRVESTVGDHETRLKALEDGSIRWKAYGAAVAVISAAIGSVVTFIEQAVFHLTSSH